MNKNCIYLFPPKSEEKTWGFHVVINGLTAEGAFAQENKFAFDQAMEYLSKCDTLTFHNIKWEVGLCTE